MVLTWENKSRIPDIYFAWSEDFDYRKYVEEKSHFDEVVLAVDRSTSEIVGSADRLTQHIGEGVQVLSGGIDQVGQAIGKGLDAVQAQLGDLDSTLDRGFSAISFNLEAIDRSVQDLSLICDMGFDKVAAQTARSNELLEDLIGLIKTPDQVWAREQYEYAKECMSRDLWGDALGFADKAINGDDRNSGLYIEPAFHFLRGDILLHYPEVGEGNAFVEKALSSFLDAVKYCGAKQPELKALALLRASWCHYCLGNKKEAVATIQEAEKLHGTPIGSYHLAKYLASLNDSAASGALLKAILADELLFVRATNDADFSSSAIDLEAIAQKARDHRVQQLSKYCNETFKYEEVKELAEIADKAHCDEIARFLKSYVKTLTDLRQKPTLSGMNEYFRNESKRSTAEYVHGVIGRRFHEVEKQINSLKNWKFTPDEAKYKSRSTTSNDLENEKLLGVLIAFVIIVFWVAQYAHWIIGVIVAVFLAGPVGIIGSIIVVGLIELGNHTAAKRDQAEEQTVLDRKNAERHAAALESRSLGEKLQRRISQ
jgi:tetratricopeptide (TPR) repeat protein